QFHEKKDRIYRILSDYERSKNQYATSPPPLAAELAEYPAVETTTQLVPAVGGDVTFEEKSKGIDGHFADQGFFNVFSFELEAGNRTTALKEPYSMVVSQDLAEFLFRDENPVGKTVQFIDRKMKQPHGEDSTRTLSLEWGNFTITGVI